MDGILLPAIFLLAPALAVLVLRCSGALVFLSVCLGSVLATYVAGDASTILSSATPDRGDSAMQWAQLGLLIIPVIATILFTRKKAKGGKLIIGVLASLAAGGLLLLIAAPFMTDSLRSSFSDNQLWHELENLQTSIVIAGAALVLGELFMDRQKHENSDKKHK